MLSPEEIKEKESSDYIFKDLKEVFIYLYDIGWSQIKLNRYSAPYFDVMSISDNKCAYFPMPMSPLYRGQNTFYTDCKPSLYRTKWTKNMELERQIQFEDFKTILQDNPEVKGLMRVNLRENYCGLAQHYGMATNLMDFTNSPLVAAFFATTEYDEITNTYRPVTNKLQVGALYFSALGGMLNMPPFTEKPSELWPIGSMALARPSEQRGYGLIMGLHDNLNTMMGYSCFKFWQNSKLSIDVFNMTKGGEIFFPYDPMVEKVRMMQSTRVYGKDSLQKICKKNNKNYSETKMSLTLDGCQFLLSTPFKYTDKELKYINEEYSRKFPNG